jgi:DegV family protein with EDD domain
VGVAVITDSAAALPAALAERHNITIVPMWLTLGGRLVRDGDISIDEVVTHDDVSTSGPSPGEFTAAIESRASEDGVVVLTIAATMSSTFAAAQQGAASVPVPVSVLDTSTAAGAEALVVLHAARAAERGATLSEVQDAATRCIDAVRLVAMLSDLDHLARSGRVPEAASRAGRRLRLRPLFEFRNGKARPLRPALSVDAAKDRMVAMVTRSRTPGARLHVAALHAKAREDAEELLGRVEAAHEPATSFVAPFSTVMIAHTGPGLAGLAWWWESP